MATPKLMTRQTNAAGFVTKGKPLTNQEVDNNFVLINEKAEQALSDVKVVTNSINIEDKTLEDFTIDGINNRIQIRGSVNGGFTPPMSPADNSLLPRELFLNVPNGKLIYEDTSITDAAERTQKFFRTFEYGPYETKEEAFEATSKNSVRYPGLTVGVTNEDNTVTEYWYPKKGSLSFVEKSGGVDITTLSETFAKKTDLGTMSTENKADCNITKLTVTDTIIGNIATANKLKTAVKVKLTGDVISDPTTGVTFDGSGDLTLATKIGSHTHAIANVTGLQTALDTKLEESDIQDRYAKLTADKKIPASMMPAGVDEIVDVLNFAALEALPADQKSKDKIYLTTGANGGQIYRWSGTAFVEITPSAGTSDKAMELANPVAIGTTATSDVSWAIAFTGNEGGTVAAPGKTAAATLKVMTGLTAGTYNDLSATGVNKGVTPFTVDNKGRITAVGTTQAITVDWTNVANKPAAIAGLDTTAFVAKTEKDAASGVAGLNASKKVLGSVVPTIKIKNTAGTVLGTSAVNGTEIDIQISAAGATLTKKTDNVTYYPTFTNSTDTTLAAAHIDDAKLKYNPSTGLLTATQFNATSDVNKKDNVISINNALITVNQLRGVGFNWKDNGLKSYGVIAQELETIIPELVSESDDVKTVNYNGLIGFLIESVKELSAQLDELKSKL